MMNQGLYEYLLGEQDKSVSGWNFEYLERTGRMAEFPALWHYQSIIKGYLTKSNTLLDMGTEDGEILASLSPLPVNSYATEGDQPNALIAAQRLKPLGVSVVAIESNDDLPFKDQTFDLIINRHESFNATEVTRLLQKDGVFVTQQVGGLNDCELNVWLCSDPAQYSNWSLRVAVEQLQEAGLTILDAKDDISLTRFYDVGALVYYLKVVNWQIPDFTVEKYFDRLEMIHNLIEEKGYIDITKHRFLIIAKKEISTDL